MALIKCTECGKEISDSAVTCPNCGCKTAHGKKNEEVKIFNRTNYTVNGICIAMDIIGAILFFPGIFKLHDYGYTIFDWGQSSRDIILTAGRKGTIGLVLIVIGVVGSILYKKYLDRFNVSSIYSARDYKLGSSYTNATSQPSSGGKYCPHCGEVTTSDVCSMCGKGIHS